MASQPEHVSSAASIVHKTTCAINSTGHRGPCTCGAESSAATPSREALRRIRELEAVNAQQAREVGRAFFFLREYRAALEPHVDELVYRLSVLDGLRGSAKVVAGVEPATTRGVGYHSDGGPDRRDRPLVPPVSDKGSGTPSGPSSAATTEPPVETAKRIVREIDTYGDPRLYALADEYLRLREVVDCLLPANGCSTVEEALVAFGNPA